MNHRPHQKPTAANNQSNLWKQQKLGSSLSSLAFSPMWVFIWIVWWEPAALKHHLENILTPPHPKWRHIIFDIPKAEELINLEQPLIGLGLEHTPGLNVEGEGSKVRFVPGSILLSRESMVSHHEGDYRSQVRCKAQQEFALCECVCLKVFNVHSP